MGLDGWSLLGRLKRAVKKITFLLNFDLNKWKLASMIKSSSVKRRVSFNDRPGLRLFMDDSDSNDDSGSCSSRMLRRTFSSPSQDDDIDKRAEMFIANFYNQLRIERQISLELRYARGNNTGSPSP